MAWFNRPEGFITKSFDQSAPTAKDANDIKWESDLLPLPLTSHEDCCGWTGKDMNGWDCGNIIPNREDDSWMEEAYAKAEHHNPFLCDKCVAGKSHNKYAPLFTEAELRNAWGDR